MNGVTYDTGALIARDRNDRALWALHAGLLAEEVVVTVPSAVVARRQSTSKPLSFVGGV